jgi:hypothetical protein
VEPLPEPLPANADGGGAGDGAPVPAAPGAGLTEKHYLLLNFLKQAGAGPVPPITRVLALPGLPLKPGQSLGPELPAWRILTRDKLRQPFAALREAVSGGRPWASWRELDRTAQGDLGPGQMRKLLELLAPRVLAQPALDELLGAETGEDRNTRHRLAHLAHNFSQGRYRIHGAAGSGKSLLGRKVARLWAAEGLRVLVLVSSRDRADAAGAALEDLVRSRQAAVSSYRDLALDLLEEARVPAPSGPNPDLGAALARVAASIRTRWDALVLDDAQDLGPAWIEPLLKLLPDPGQSPVLVLEDPPGQGGAPSAMPGQPWQLDLKAMRG